MPSLQHPRIVVLGFLLMLVGPLGAQDAKKVVATVNGQPITEADVHESARDQFRALEREYRKSRRSLLENSLETLIEDRMIDLEASARGISQAQLEEREMTAAGVTDAEVDAFYERTKSQVGTPKEQAIPQIKAYLEGQRKVEVRQSFLGKLRAKYKPELLMEPQREALTSIGFPSRGPDSAPVTIVVFLDYESKVAAGFWSTLLLVLSSHPDQVRLVVRQFPVGFHVHAQKAAEAALCAKEQGKFWPMHEVLLKDPSKLTVDALKAHARSVGLDGAAFDAALDSGKYAAVVKKDVEEASAVGIAGPPGTFINGRLLSGAVPRAHLENVIVDELKRASPAK
jgi:protein-disulfide isomerase